MIYTDEKAMISLHGLSVFAHSVWYLLGLEYFLITRARLVNEWSSNISHNLGIMSVIFRKLTKKFSDIWRKRKKRV